jgi:hypothetical protein
VLIGLWRFLFPIFLFAAQQKEFFLDGLKSQNSEVVSVWSSGGICRVLVNTFFFNPVACCFLYKAKDLSPPIVSVECISDKMRPDVTGSRMQPFL